MDSTKTWIDLLFYLAPVIIIAGALYMLVKNMFDRDYKIKLIESKRLLQKEALPLRLQAYERMVLFLERISPNNLLFRIHVPGNNVRELQTELLNTIRSEFEHNLTQQLYMSGEAWIAVKNAKENLIKTINIAASGVNPADNGLELSKKIFEVIQSDETNPVQHALDTLKHEVSQLY